MGPFRRKPRAMAAITAVLAMASAGFAAETDNLTYRFVRLEDSAPKLNSVVNRFLARIAEQVNENLTKRNGDPSRASDTEIELAFATTYRAVVLRRFRDRLLPIFEACVEQNDCPEWPRFERIVLEGGESIYGESRYNRIAINSLAPSIDLCGVRVGTDKLTHLFSNGFFYYNASRRKGSKLEDAADVYRLSLIDEHGLMGARSTAVVSPADAEATRGGYRMATDYFFGDDPVFARDEGGSLRKRRDLDVCRYVSKRWDEVLNPPVFTARRGKVAKIEAAIAERIAENERALRSMSVEEKQALRLKLVGRSLPPDHGRLSFFAKITISLQWGIAYFTIPKEARRAIGFLVFPKFNLEDRRPVVLRRVSEGKKHDATASGFR